jgi:hypothetical protein
MISALLAAALSQASLEQLVDALQRRLETSRTLRVEEDIVARASHPQGNYTARVTTLIKGNDRWFTEFRVLEGGDPGWRHVVTRCDGQSIRVDSPSKIGMENLKPDVVGPLLRRQFASGSFSDVHLPLLQDGKRFKKEAGPVRDGGRPRVDGRDQAVLIRDIRNTWGDGDPYVETVRLVVDVEALRPVRVEGVGEGESWVSTFRVFALDEALDDAAFALQSPGDLDRALAGQAARAAELFARFTGRLPRSPEELVRRPADLPGEVYYPEGGFVLDGSIPDVTLNGAAAVRGRESVPIPPASGRAVGAPTERIRRHYDARVRVQLLASAVQAYRDATGGFPRKAADLWTARPGWIPGGRLPDDPWGRPFRLITDADWVRVQVQDTRTHRLRLKDLTPEERTALEAAAQPHPTEEDRRAIRELLARAIDDDLETREAARQALRARGPVSAGFLDEGLKAPRDLDAARWLKEARSDFPQAAPAWITELASLSHTVRRGPSDSAAPPDVNEMAASFSLKTIASAQADFRGNDRDDNKIQDFWTGDVAGLYGVKAQDGQTIKLIELSVAAADAAPLEAEGPWQKIEPRAPKDGYHFQAMVLDGSCEPSEPYRADTQGDRKMGRVHNTSRFGGCAFPAEYGLTGVRTFILNEGNTVFWKDSGGEPVLEWPSEEELRREWKKLD